MKSVFSKSAGRLRVKSWAFLLGLMLSVFAAKATLSLYSNSGTISGTPPQVDATNFYNSGTWNISTAAPYETTHTLNYTNTGTMTGSVGWEFDYGTGKGGRSLSANFINGNSVTIQANDGLIANYYGDYLVSYLLVSATNIVNKGTLVAGPHGEIVLTGANATLARSTLEITPIAGQGSSNHGTNFTPDVQIYSMFWGTNNMGLNSTTLWNGTNVFTGTNITSGTLAVPLSFLASGNVFDIPSSSSFYGTVYNENLACGSSNITVQIVPFTVFAGTNGVGCSSTNIVVAVTNIVYTNTSGGSEITNLFVHIIRQAVFLNIETNSGIIGQVRFSPSSNPTNAAQTVAVRLTATSTNVITLLPQTSSIYLVDTLLSETNQGLNVDTNSDPYYLCSGVVHRPANYNVSRLDSGNYFAIGSPGSGLPPNNFFYDTNLTSEFVLANYTDYAAYIDSLASDQQSVAGVTGGLVVTNLAGRIIINANNLDLTRANLVAGGYIKIQATNLVSSANAVVNCQYLSYNLGSTNGNLNFTNLASQSISQLQGNIVAWSAMWTNFTTQVISNYVYNTNNTPNPTPAFITNTTEIDFYALVVDASSLADQVSVTVQDLILHSTNIVVSDSMTVANSLLLDGQSFTLLGEMYLSGALQDWTSANAPKLLYFTNTGILYIPNDAHFGDDTAVPYVEFVNTATRSPYEGIIEAADQTILSRDIQINDGVNYTFTGDFSATAGSIEITGPPSVGFSDSIYSANDINLSANTLLIDPAALYASGALSFNVTNSLSDNGAADSFTCYNGFNLWIKPQTGDLLGSTITSIASADSEEIDHAWAGKDYGLGWTGFSNNVAIGTLVLSAQNPNPNNYRLEPLFHFYGTGPSSNAMYVNTLDLSGLTTNSADVANMIQIDPGMKIYFYQVILGFTNLPGGQTPETFLQAQFPGQTYAVPPGTNAAVSITVDAQAANQTPISPMIYGVAFATSNQLADLNFTMNRSGGNAETRYNWLLNCHNRASDWYFESIPDEYIDGVPFAPGATADNFVANSKGGGAQPLITIPIIGWSPFLGASRSTIWSYSIAKYGPQTDSDIHNAPYNNPDAGNGISVTNNTPITWNNPTDANFHTNANFQQGYVKHLISRWGASTNGGVRYYLMDNEHSLWYSTHQDIHPVGPTMQEIWTNMLTYASMVKSNDPNALVCGPEEWGWNGYLYSGYDQQWFNRYKDYNPADFPDRKANGGWDYMPWLLNHFQQNNTTNHQRLLDYFTVHCYPQEGNVSGDDVDTPTELLRNESTRVFWDTNYVDPSWINNIIMVIPRMKIWVATNYPGTKIGITEYNWGAEPYINGATAQADILGIFGRQGLDLATRWETPASNTPTYLAMKLYRNYDGNKSTFGNMSIPVVVPNPDDLSIFGAVRTNDGAMTFMVINKDLHNDTPISLNITNSNVLGTVQRWHLTSSNVISQLSNITLTNGGVLNDIVPVQSITLYVLPVESPFNLQTSTKNSAGHLAFSLAGLAGQTYVLQSSTDLFHWVAVSTNTLISNSFPYVVATTNKAKFYRGLFMPP